MGLLDNLNKLTQGGNNDNLTPLESMPPTEEEIRRITKEIGAVIRKKVVMQYLICIIAGILIICLPIGYIKTGTFDFKSIMVMIATILACVGAIAYIVMATLPRKKLIYNNFKAGLYSIYNVNPSQMYLRTVREGKENQYGKVEFINQGGAKETMSVLFLANDVHTYNKNKKELVKVQVIKVDSSEEIYGLMYFARRGYFY